MTIQEFLKRCLSHAAMALSLWMLFALTAEHLLPGFVASLVDIPFIGSLVVGLLSLSAYVHAPSSRIGKILGIGSCFTFGCIFVVFLWAKMSTSGLSGTLLGMGLCVSGGLTIYALAVDSNNV